jgi:hypothetical protein
MKGLSSITLTRSGAHEGPKFYLDIDPNFAGIVMSNMPPDIRATSLLKENSSAEMPDAQDLFPPEVRDSVRFVLEAIAPNVGWIIQALLQIYGSGLKPANKDTRVRLTRTPDSHTIELYGYSAEDVRKILKSLSDL